MKANTKLKLHNKYEVKILRSSSLQSSCMLIQTILWLSFILPAIHNKHNCGLMHQNKGKTILALPKAQYLNPLPLTCPMHLNHYEKLG